MMQVDKAIIHFNTRSAAQLRLNNGCDDNPVCIASPADALLHELLHTHSMLVKSEEFIAQGGMNNVIYPYEHEYSVIGKERKLYASMSSQDDIKRPQRREHTGRTVKANAPHVLNKYFPFFHFPAIKTIFHSSRTLTDTKQMDVLCFCY